MATIHCHPADGLRPPAPPGANLDVGKPRTGWASRSGLLEIVSPTRGRLIVPGYEDLARMSV